PMASRTASRGAVTRRPTSVSRCAGGRCCVTTSPTITRVWNGSRKPAHRPVRHNARVSSEQASSEVHRSGFGSLVRRPNVGKSTLTNALVGAKIAIPSQRPQTTRHAVRGIVHRPDAQLVVVDTPGMHRPRTLLGERLDDVVRTTWAEVDVIACC